MKNVMDYGKARGMALVEKYLPQLNPFQYMDVVGTLEEWEQVRSKYGEMVMQRFDYPIGSVQVKQNAGQGTDGLATSMPKWIELVQSQGESGVITIAQTTFPPPLRYLYLGGFNILFCLGSHAVIELVGKAFDGHELTQGLACHERYCLNWDDVLYVTSRADLMRNSTEKSRASAEQYQIQRRERIKFLSEVCHFPLAEVEANVPKTLPLLDDSALRLLLDDVVVELYRRRAILEHDGLMVFGVQGNIVEHNGQIIVQPWEIFLPERWS